MIEAVGEKYLDKYFQRLKIILKPEVLVLYKLLLLKMNYLINIEKVKILFKNIFFLVVFLPSLQSIKDHTEKSGLELTGYNSYGISLFNTLKEWRENFIRSWSDISKQGFDQSLKKFGILLFSIVKRV